MLTRVPSMNTSSVLINDTFKSNFSFRRASFFPNKITSWGDDSFEQRTVPAFANGIPASQDASTRASSPDLSHSIYDVTASRSHSCSIRSPSRIGCWGSNLDASLKDKLGFSKSLSAIMVSAGTYFSCAVTRDGDVQCAGSNYGNARKPPYSSCHKVALVYRQGNPVCNSSRGKYLAVSASVEHACAIDANSGVVRCWGRDGGTGDLDHSQYRPLGCICRCQAKAQYLVKYMVSLSK